MQYEIKPLRKEDEAYIGKKIGEYAYMMAPPEPGTPEEEQIIFRAEDENGTFAGGCVVNVHEWGRAVLAMLWVEEPHRRTGLGSMLLKTAERAVRERGCHYLCLGTMDFMARGFYEKHGYTVFTVNRDHPKGHVGWSLSRRVDREIPEHIPTNNSAAVRFTIKPGSKEDVTIIEAGFERYNGQFVPDEHDDLPIGKKLVDQNGSMIAGVIAEVDGWNGCEIDGIWVEEPYRKQGLGTYLFSEIEREAKENGAYVLFTYCCDWVLGFFEKNGCSVRGTLPDYPKGHTAYELEKRI